MKPVRAVCCCALIFAATEQGAMADGAFPNSQSILLPVGKPSDVLLVTNFGLVISHDEGRSWLWSCERDENAWGLLYQVSGPPRNRVYALANQKVVFSDDGTCGWQSAGGALALEAATDYFLDPSNPDRVIAVGLPDGGNYEVLESTNAGATFDKVLHQASPADFITGVEVAASDPRTIYLAISRNDGVAIGRTSDGGGSWTITDLSARVTGSAIRIISVDPHDPMRALFLTVHAGSASVVLTTDGGASISTPVTMPAVFNSFARLSSGTLFIAGTLTSAGPVLLRSRDGGKSFDQVANPPEVLGLGARGDRVYAALNYMSTRSALAASNDEGQTWKTVMTFSDVRAVLGCVKDACRTLCEGEAMLGVWSQQVCSAVEPPGSADSDADARGGPMGNTPSSCHGCRIAAEPMDSWSDCALSWLGALWLLRRPTLRKLVGKRRAERVPPVAPSC